VDKGTACAVLGADDALSCLVQERGRRDAERPWDGLMAEAVAFLLTAHASLQNLTSESFRDPQASQVLALLSEKVIEALCTLDDVNLARWIKRGPSAGTSCSVAPAFDSVRVS
jgi:hypothetical protein